MKNYLLLLTIAFVIASCSKTTEIDLNEKLVIEPMADNAVDFSNLVHGQESIYEGYSYSCDRDVEAKINDNFLYLGVIQKDDKWFFTESFDRDGVKTVEREYEVIPSEDMLRIPVRIQSFLFHFYDSDKIDLNPKKVLPIEQTNCVFSDGEETFDGDAIAFSENFDFRGVSYKGKLALSCIPTIIFGDAYLIHDTRQLIMSHLVIVTEFGDEISTSVSGFRLKK